MLWNVQLPELPLAGLSEAVEFLGLGEALQEHHQEQEWHFVLCGAQQNS